MFAGRQNRQAALWVPIYALCAAGLIWPALWNGYPIVFADSGTYLSQAMHRYLGWDRPVFYSLFSYPLHLGLTLWPVVLVQSGLAVFVLDLTRRGFGVARGWLPVAVLFLSVATWLPWTVSELMPDLFTPLLILLLSLLVFIPTAGKPDSSCSRHPRARPGDRKRHHAAPEDDVERWCHGSPVRAPDLRRPEFASWEHAAVIALAAFMISTQQSSVLLSLGFLSVFVPLRWIAGQRRLMPLLAPVLAIAALTAVNVVGHKRVSISPYGNVFLLARVIYDGPGMTVLRDECPSRGWRLCPFLDRFPPTSDEFLWDPASPIVLAGGHKAVSADASAIIRDALLAEPGRALLAVWNNTLEQIARFDSGDGLEAWPAQVDGRIDGDFGGREAAAYHAARQQNGALVVPFAGLHWIVAVGGIVAALGLLPVAWRRRHVSAWFLAAALLVLPVSAAITGGLSTPHDRYQSRIVWLPALMALLTIPALRRR